MIFWRAEHKETGATCDIEADRWFDARTVAMRHFSGAAPFQIDVTPLGEREPSKTVYRCTWSGHDFGRIPLRKMEVTKEEVASAPTSKKKNGKKPRSKIQLQVSTSLLNGTHQELKV